MNTLRLRATLYPLSLLLLAMLACDAPFQRQVAVEATETMQALATRVAGTEASMGAAADAGVERPPASDAESETEMTAEASATPTPSETPTATPCVPMVSVSVDTKCRTGPGSAYGYLGALLVGERAEVVGQSSVPNYWVIDNPDNPGQSCWLWGQYAQVICDTGALPILTPPPTPTATSVPLPDWSGTWTTWSSEYFDPFVIHIEQSEDSLSGYFTAGGVEYTFSASLSEDGMSAVGHAYRSPGGELASGLCWLLLENENQFRGTYCGWGSWCGARHGASKPSPCDY